MGHRHNTHPVCPWWFGYTFDNPVRRLVHDADALLGHWLAPGMHALDLGCGLGFFSLAMARMVGDGGTVLAVDMQERMLATVRRRARKAGLDGRIRTLRCTQQDLMVQGQEADFALAFWMVHEVPDQNVLFSHIHAGLRPGGLLFVAEPRLDVREGYFQKELERAAAAGFSLVQRPQVRFSFAAVLRRRGD